MQVKGGKTTKISGHEFTEETSMVAIGYPQSLIPGFGAWSVQASEHGVLMGLFLGCVPYNEHERSLYI